MNSTAYRSDSMDHSCYQNPLISRYSSKQMGALFGAQKKFGTWRRLWLALAEAQLELGLEEITPDQLDEMRAHLDDIDYAKAAEYEQKLRHDVMAHVHTFSDVCPLAKPIIHNGATSCFVTDNADLVIFREALDLIAARLSRVIEQWGSFALQQRHTACLGFTHLQPAQPTTVGKRATLWAYDLVMDWHQIVLLRQQLKARGVKGTTGTQASFLKLFNGDHDKVKELDRRVGEKIGFSETYPVTGQTYPRKVDVQIVDALSGIAQSAHKCANDLRLLASRKEVEEPFESQQIGSSAMPYKRNPMRSERICSLARFVISLQSSPANTLATQWLERTLDDSANRRLVIPQAFLAIDAILMLLENVTSGLIVNESVIQKNLLEELPFMASENILLAAVSAGGDRQSLHELIRQHSIAAGNAVKRDGKSNDLIERLRLEPALASVDFDKILDVAEFVGRAPEQVVDFVHEYVKPISENSKDSTPLSEPVEIRV